MKNRFASLGLSALGGLLMCVGANAQTVSIAGYADPSCTSIVNFTTANGGQYLTFRPNGTWVLGENKLSVDTVLDNGTWTTGTFSGANYQIRTIGTFTYDHESGGGSGCQDPDNSYETNFNSGWVTLSSNFILNVSANTFKDGFCEWAQDINGFSGTVEIRQTSTPANASSIGVNLCVSSYAD